MTHETNAHHYVYLCLYIISIMFDVLADHRNNLLIQMCRVELQVGLSISFTSDFFVIGLLHLLLYFYTVIICKVYIYIY